MVARGDVRGQPLGVCRRVARDGAPAQHVARADLLDVGEVGLVLTRVEVEEVRRAVLVSEELVRYGYMVTVEQLGKC